MKLLLLLMVALPVYSVTIGGINVPRERVIAFLFIGNCDMAGNCAKTDSFTSRRCWQYSKQSGFIQARDPMIMSRNNSGTPVLEFLKKMSELDTERYFISVMMAGASQETKDFLPESLMYRQLVYNVHPIVDSVSFGGLLMMFGCGVGNSEYYSNRMCKDMRILIDSIRSITKEKYLPVILGRYESNSDTSINREYHRFKKIIESKIDSMPIYDSLLFLTPDKPIDKSNFCCDHTYSLEGYKIWADYAAIKLYMSNDDALSMKRGEIDIQNMHKLTLRGLR